MEAAHLAIGGEEEEAAAAEATETTATAIEDATTKMPTIETIDAATGRDPVTGISAGRIGIETADETDQGHAIGHIAMGAVHQEIVLTEAIATATTPGALEIVVAEELGQAMEHRNIERVCSFAR